MDSLVSAEKALRAGVEVLDPVLEPCGFHFILQSTQKGSGGYFASGRYVRDDRFLELHYRYSLGLVTYHLGDDSLDHENYMRFLGVYGSNAYPDFPQDSADSFRSLARDLERYCGNFLRGDGIQFRQFAADWKSNPKKFTGLP